VGSPAIARELTGFLADLAREGAAPKTLRSYRSDLAHFAGWFAESAGEAFAPAAVTPTDVRDYRAALLTVANRAPATVNRRLAALRRFFRWAKAQKLVAELPTEGVRGVNTPKKAPKSLAKREVDRLVRHAERAGRVPSGRRDLAVLELLRHTGLRVGELCALRLGDVAIGERKGVLTVRSGKGGKYRQVPLNADARRALTAYLAVRPTSAEERLFLGAGARPLGPQGVADLVAKHARRAGLDDVTPHTLRHTFARRLLDEGASLVDVAALLGHEKPRDDGYLHAAPSARPGAGGRAAGHRLIRRGGQPAMVLWTGATSGWPGSTPRWPQAWQTASLTNVGSRQRGHAASVAAAVLRRGSASRSPIRRPTHRSPAQPASLTAPVAATPRLKPLTIGASFALGRHSWGRRPRATSAALRHALGSCALLGQAVGAGRVSGQVHHRAQQAGQLERQDQLGRR
jgi:site-specific recombinase XerD